MNPVIEMLDTEVLSDNWYVLRKFTYRIRRADGTSATHSREAYDRAPCFRKRAAQPSFYTTPRDEACC